MYFLDSLKIFSIKHFFHYLVVKLILFYYLDMKYDLQNMATFGVAGNFTGHLEQAGEAKDFVNVKTKEANAPKAVFPTYIPSENNLIPEYLKTFPFDSDKIAFPKNV